MSVTLPQDQVLAERFFSRGIVRDAPRHSIPPGGVYDAVDFLFDKPGVAYKRGGSAFQSSELAGEALVVAVAAPEFPGDPRVIAIASDGADTRTLYDVTDTTAAAGIDVNGAQPTENPPLYVDTLIITDGIGDGAGNYAAVQKAYISGSDVAVAELGGTPPNARYSCTHLSYLVLANGIVSSVEYPNRLWFSPIPDIEADWDTAGAYFDVPSPITGLASVSGVLIVFTRGFTYRILGNIPPGTSVTDDNMELQPLGAVGCIDARSIVKMNGLVYFADETGVYYTPGEGYESITTRRDGAGIGALWADAISGFAPALGAVVCAGVWLNRHLFITVRHPGGSRSQFLYHEPSGAWTQLADGVTATMYATRFAPDGELYAGCGDTDDPVRVLKLSGVFDPGSGNTADANGEAVAPLMELRPYGDDLGLKAFGYGRITYRMTASGSPTIAVATSPTVFPAAYTTRKTLDVDATRSRFPICFDAQEANVKITQTGASSTTEILAVEVEVRPYPLGADL